MGIYKSIVEGFLGPIASTADIQRFGKWKNELEDALEELENSYKRKKITKSEYTKRKTILKGKLKKAKELIKKSEERFEKTAHQDVRY